MVAEFAQCMLRERLQIGNNSYSVKLCTLNVMCMVAIIVEIVNEIDMYVSREVAGVVGGVLGIAQV